MWYAITYGGKSSPKFYTAHAAGVWANKAWGLGNWTLEWRVK